MSVFSDNLNMIMTERGISQKWLADAANTTEATISRYANGVHKPNVDIIVQIAQALCVSIDYLMGLSVIPSGQSDETAEEQVLVKCYRRATDRDQNLVWGVLEEYLHSPAEKTVIAQFRQEKRG